MRVTIDIPDNLRAAVVSLSARRGYRGYGRLVIEAIEHYLAELERRDGGIERLMAMQGSWSEAEAGDVRSRVAEVRANYRRMKP
ncbi:MAG: hypothetical protein PHU25_19000 [Deltaproteobacteria bacterium]|nr:hypothetical protein [Deltaproteobacteria bacterium]